MAQGVDVSGWIKKKALIDKQARFAAAVALTRTAKDAQKDVAGRMPQIFDRPTKATQNSLAIIPARKNRLVSAVFVKDKGAVKPVRWLAIQITGGTRQARPGRPVIVPENLKLNRLGNLTKKRIPNLLKRERVFVVGRDREPGFEHLKPGIYERPRRRKRKRKRRGGTSTQAESLKPKLLISFGRRARYKPQFPFARLVRNVVNARFKSNYEKAIADALRTAR